MTDVFIAYSHADRRVAQELADGLSAIGLKVWWDLELLAGSNFTEVILTQIEQARCVIVIWSKHSVRSQWVIEEARMAADYEKLLPLNLDVGLNELPLAMRMYQTERIDQIRQGDRFSPRFIEAIRHFGLLGGAHPPLAGPRTLESALATPRAASPPSAPPKQAHSGDVVATSNSAPPLNEISRKAFISYASEDEATAISLVKYLEAQKCPCWISFRDVDPGEDYRDSIMKALAAVSFLVLVYSKHVNESFDVATELLIARKKNKRRFVLKTDASPPDGKIEYELATVQWIDCINDVESGFARMANRAQLL